MAEDTTAEVEQTEQTERAEEPQGAGADAGAAGDTDWRAEYDRVLAASRKWERRAKDNAQKAREYDELHERSAAEAKRAEEATRRAEQAEARVAEFERRAERDALVAEVAREAGVDAQLLGRMAGDTREEVEASARLLSERVGAMRLYPSVGDSGRQLPPQPRTNFSDIRDPVERVRARAEELARHRG